MSRKRAVISRAWKRRAHAKWTSGWPRPIPPRLGRAIVPGVLILLVLAMMVAAGWVSAQAVDLQTAVARACWSEAGLNSMRDGECHALFRALVNKSMARGVPLATHIRQYCPRSQNPARTDHRRWLADLWPDGREPRGWGRHPWANSRPGWRRLYAYAGELLANPWMDQNPCWFGVEPIDWGIEPAVGNYQARNRRSVVVYCGTLPVCGGTDNVFLRPEP